MTRTLQEQLVKKGVATAEQEKTRKERRRERHKRFQETGFYSEKSLEKELRTREIEELMGIRRSTYKRVGGVIRQK